MRLSLILALFIPASCATAGMGEKVRHESVALTDSARSRRIPVEIYFPSKQRRCTRRNPCAVAFVSPGYGLPHTGYSFIAEPLARAGRLVIAIQHDLRSDPVPSRTGDLIAARTPMWQRGAENLRFVRNTLSERYPAYDWSNPVLIGHSNGGDISALALTETPSLASMLITLDNRRYPLPRSRSIKVLSIRGSDFEADPGVLPTGQELEAFGSCVTEIAGARHDDMYDEGPADLKDKINAVIGGFLDGRCGD